MRDNFIPKNNNNNLRDNNEFLDLGFGFVETYLKHLRSLVIVSIRHFQIVTERSKEHNPDSRINNEIEHKIKFFLCFVQKLHILTWNLAHEGFTESTRLLISL